MLKSVPPRLFPIAIFRLILEQTNHPMRYLLILLALMAFSGCDLLSDIEELEGPCTILLVDGRTVSTSETIEILESTGTLTYRDEDGKLWSLTSEEYESYSCN